jgi:predicted O-methyltransferase YrrM
MKNLVKKSFRIIKNEGWGVFLRKIDCFLQDRLNEKEKLIFNHFLKSSRLVKNKIISRLKKFNSNTPEEVFDFISSKFLGVFAPTQIKEEFLELLKIFQKQNPKYILEIGTANGGSLFCFCKLAQDNATIISIDLPGGKFGGGYPEWKIPIYQAFAKKNQKFYLLRKDSHSQETLGEVKKILNGNQLDFLFIDGDHSYEGVKKDFEMYSPLVKKGGVIAFHDIVFGPEENVGGVPKFWEEIKRNFQTQEIVKNWSQKGYGLGVIFKLL